MKNQRIKVLSSILLISTTLVFAAFCGTSKMGQAKKSGDFTRGVKLWSNTCQRCHNLRDSKDFADKDWFMIMQHMRARAGLTGQETRDIAAFLRASNQVT